MRQIDTAFELIPLLAYRKARVRRCPDSSNMCSNSSYKETYLIIRSSYRTTPGNHYYVMRCNNLCPCLKNSMHLEKRTLFFFLFTLVINILSRFCHSSFTASFGNWHYSLFWRTLNVVIPRTRKSNFSNLLRNNKHNSFYNMLDWPNFEYVWNLFNQIINT